MTMNALSRVVRLVPVAAAFTLGLSGSTFALGTQAQREACAPDAIRLCQDTIPDETKTAACMKSHEAELSPTCRRSFVAATGEPAAISRSRRRVARVQPATPAAEEGVGVALPGIDQLNTGQLELSPDDETPASRAADRRNARRVVNRLCRSNVLDAGTCQLTQSAIDLSR